MPQDGTAPAANVPYISHDKLHKEFICGLGSAMITMTLTYPVTKLIYRQILEQNTASKSFNNLRSEGLLYLYRGILPPMVQKCCSLSTMFSMYQAGGNISRVFPNNNEKLRIVFGSVFAGTLETIFMPFERIQILLIHRKYYTKFKNMPNVLRILGKEYGFREYYRGYSIILCRNVLSDTLFFLSRDELRNRITETNSAYMQSVHNFLLGALAGTIMTTVFYPMKVMKANAHSEIGTPFRSNKEIFLSVYHQNGNGIRNFYRGVALNAFRSLFSWGIANTVYEAIKKNVM